MSAVSLPVSRPGGRALVVAGPAGREQVIEALTGMGLECDPADDPYAATAELCRRPGSYGAVVLSLSSLYREELTLIATVKRRWPRMEVWLAHTDGRQAALAEGMRLGADGLLAEDGLHRIAGGVAGGVAGADAAPLADAVDSDNQAEADSSPNEAVAQADLPPDEAALMADVVDVVAAPLPPSEEPRVGDEGTPEGERAVAVEEESSQDEDDDEDDAADAAHDILGPDGEPLLTAEELRALLQEQPSASDARGSEE